jgi:hypothetical protein
MLSKIPPPIGPLVNGKGSWAIPPVGGPIGGVVSGVILKILVPVDPLPPGEYRFPGNSNPGKDRLMGGGAKMMLGVWTFAFIPPDNMLANASPPAAMRNGV